MPEDETYPIRPRSGSGRPRPAIPAALLSMLAIAAMTLAGIGARFACCGDFNLLHAALTLFFAVNLMICYWEWCLFVKRDYIEQRARFWHERWKETGRAPPVEFLSAKVPLSRLLSTSTWADVWAAYCHIDSSYSDRRTYGYNVDVGNGLTTPLPSLVLFVAYTFALLPAQIAGIIGAMLFWQLAYATSVYWISFFMAKRHVRISRRDLHVYIFALNSPWILCPLLGLFVSVRLIIDGNYGVLGH